MLSSTLPLVNHLHPLPCSMTDWVNQVWLTTSVNVRVGGGRRGKALKQRGWKLFAYQRCVSWYHPFFLLEKGIAELIFPTCLTSKSTVRECHTRCWETQVPVIIPNWNQPAASSLSLDLNHPPLLTGRGPSNYYNMSDWAGARRAKLTKQSSADTNCDKYEKFPNGLVPWRSNGTLG